MNEALDSNLERRTGLRRSSFALALLLVLSACGYSSDGNDSTKINGSIHVPAGKPPGPVATINGSVHLDENAAVTTATTVNGAVRMGPNSTAVSLNTVNGGISLDTGAKVSGSASSVNGDLTVANGAEISGSLSNVNGEIALTGAHVAGSIKTVNGSVSITGASHVDGGILVEAPTGGSLKMGKDVPRIVIGPGASVMGELRFERKVDLYVSDKATIGTVSGATPIPFTGATPPD
jgi:cytoskeletal protein CcmA (bactofilin family)